MDLMAQFPALHRRRLVLEEQIRTHMRMIEAFGDHAGGSIEQTQLAEGQLEREQAELTEMMALLDFWDIRHAPQAIPLTWHSAALLLALYTAGVGVLLFYLLAWAK